MHITWQEITGPNSPLWEQALALYDANFAPEVREPHDVLHRSVAAREEIAPHAYHLLIGLDEQSEVTALASLHYLADVNFGFLVYLLVDPRRQSQGLGALLLARAESLLDADARNAGQPALRGIILETEDDSPRRFRFFNRNGYRQLEGVSYLQPPLEPASSERVPLLLFAKSDLLASSELHAVIHSMYHQKYRRMNQIPIDKLPPIVL